MANGGQLMVAGHRKSITGSHMGRGTSVEHFLEHESARGLVNRFKIGGDSLPTDSRGGFRSR